MVEIIYEMGNQENAITDIRITCKGHEEAIAVRDDLRDYGVYANMDPKSEDWVVVVQTKALIDKFKKEFLNKL